MHCYLARFEHSQDYFQQLQSLGCSGRSHIKWKSNCLPLVEYLGGICVWSNGIQNLASRRFSRIKLMFNIKEYQVPSRFMLNSELLRY